MRGEKENSIFAYVAKILRVTRIWLIWLDEFLEQINREEKSHTDRTNWHILEQVNDEEKKIKLSVSSPLIKILLSVDKKSVTGTKKICNTFLGQLKQNYGIHWKKSATTSPA